MTRQRPSQLQLVRGLAETREQELAVEVGELMRQRSSAEATLERLGSYLDEYASGARAGGASARTLMEIENEHHFVKRLSRAIEQQRCHAERLAERARSSMTRWQRARSEVEALDRVMQRRARGEALETRRREQRDSDAHGARLGAAHGHGPGGPRETTLEIDP